MNNIKFFLAAIILFTNLSAQIPNKVFFGDLHSHSNMSFDTRVFIDTVYKYAKQTAKLDFICVSDHDLESTPDAWTTSQNFVRLQYVPGKFVPLLGYEYTRLAYGNGHRIIIYPTDRAPMFNVSSINEKALFDSVYKYGGTIHIAHPDDRKYYADLRIHDERVQKNIEIVGPNKWRFEYYRNPFGKPDQIPNHSVLDWLKGGKILGFLGVSDSHDGKPGFNSGLTAVIADTLTRTAIFNAIKNRKVYATTGARIIANFTFNGQFSMGDLVEIERGTVKNFSINVVGTDLIKKIEIVKNGEIIKKEVFGTREVDFDFQDQDFLYQSYYYARIFQQNGEMAYLSPIYFKSIPSSPVMGSTGNDENSSETVIKCFPNPFEDESHLMIQAKSREAYRIRVFDSLGKLVLNVFDGILDKGEQLLKIRMDNMASGLYILQVSTEKSTKSLKLLHIDK